MSGGPRRRPRRAAPSLEAIAEGVRAGDRVALGRAITLVESSHPAHRAEARALLDRLAPHAVESIRVGITGPPGVGKSSFIEALGGRLTAAGHRVAVLAVDPSSAVTGGSILADKTRMQRLAADPRAFVRPSPSGGNLGGVGRRTRETLAVCEAAGYDVVLVETVGVGQSETVVAQMVDVFLVLLLPGAGDEFQGIKKGVLELADVLAVNKADGDNLPRARVAAAEVSSAMSIVRRGDPAGPPPVVLISARTGDGVDALWATIEARRRAELESGRLEARRRGQRLAWTWSIVDEALRAALRAHPEVRARRSALEAEVEAGRLSPSSAAARLLEAFGLPPEPAPGGAVSPDEPPTKR